MTVYTDRKKLLNNIVVLMVLMFLFNFLAQKFYWFSSIWWFDMPMHFFGGFWVGLFGLYFAPLLFKERGWGEVGLKLFYILFFVLAIGIFWEFFEFYVFNGLGHDAFNIIDTLSDIFFDISGGFCAILYICKKQLS